MEKTSFKRTSISFREKRVCIEPKNSEIPIYRQCELLGLSKTAYYYKSKGEGAFNLTDQGSQFASTEFTEKLEASGVKISMDGRGRVFDNIFVERLWRTVKYEEVYLKNYQTVTKAKTELTKYVLLLQH